MLLCETSEEAGHAVIEIVDVGSFNSCIGLGHIWAPVNWWHIVKEEVASPVAVELRHELAFLILRFQTRAYRVEQVEIAAENCIVDLRISLIPGAVDIIDAKE